MNRARWRSTVATVVVIAVSFVGMILAEETLGLNQDPQQISATPGMTQPGAIVLATDGIAHIQLGDTVFGNVGAGGAAPVTIRFNAAEGTRVTLNVRMDSLRPTVALYDPSGVELDLGTALRTSRNQARVSYFRVPVSGNYAFKIGGRPGSSGESEHVTGVSHQGGAESEAPHGGTPGRFTATTRARLPEGVEFGTFAGLVINSLTGDPLPGVEISLGPYLLVTDHLGEFEQELPVGPYDAAFAVQYFVPYSEAVMLRVDELLALDVALTPVAPVVVIASVDGETVPGGQLTALAEVVVLDGSTVESYAWTQSFGTPATIMGAEMDIAAVQLAGIGTYKDHLFHILAEPPVGPDQLPPNVPLPEGEFPGGLQDRFEVVGLNPFALEEAALVTLAFEVLTTSGAYHGEVEIHTAIPWKPAAGIRNVPVGVPVLLHGKTQEFYDWTLLTPAGSAVMLTDGSLQNPEFTPDIPGLYEVQVTNDLDKSLVTLKIFAGTWRGVIVGQEPAADLEDDRMVPVADLTCTAVCHRAAAEGEAEGFASDQFTPWAQSGHAEIFSANLNTSTHYGPNCFSCHSVGFDPGVDSDGIDNAEGYDAFLAAGLINNPGDNWTTVLEQFPEVAKKANIQCENCHGPQNSAGHASSVSRTNLSSDVCATCHGEPLRHARFQQWQLSGHANYELAIDESQSGSCSRCHTVNGFLKWLPVLLDDNPETDPTANVDVTWTADEAHAQTCVTCHGPHSVGTTSGSNTDATVRITGDTPPLIAGFTAEGVGSGALCMTCHNSRRGLRNDDTFENSELDDNATGASRAPHGSSQTDLLFAQNAYLVEVGSEVNHGNVEDTCVNCHMEKTPPPDVLSYNQGGTNHTFFADIGTCARCHGDNFPGEAILNGVETKMDELQGMIELAMFGLIGDVLDLGNTIDLNGAASIVDIGKVDEIVFGEFRGRQSIAVRFMDGTTFGPYRLNDVDVRDGADTVIGVLYDFADPALIKSGWNWNLLHNDGSRGGHNPTFANEILDNSMDALAKTAQKGWRGARIFGLNNDAPGGDSERRHIEF